MDFKNGKYFLFAILTFVAIQLTIAVDDEEERIQQICTNILREKKNELDCCCPYSFEGLKGEPGVPGISGPRGYPGFSGYKGVKGQRGEDGYPGHKGQKGEPGNDDLFGPVFLKEEKRNPGPQGP
ncbi:macrophage receptor MARCO-like [Leptopilina heterotoma]|uniref:macrophage receptor MARCO-like n=1 Tax=Leptopilina heterotoma TaxID=63436 RepID=UPI001CA9E6BC|nr:macrophage receptor MARCO-like [Leptopilina heterotoma]